VLWQRVRPSVKFRDWSDAQPRTPLPTHTPLARFVAEARQHLSSLVVVWQQVAAALDTDGPEIFEHAWNALDHVEGERLLAGFTS
jgi:hypothetical protein